MSECPAGANERNCGLKAAEWLVNEQEVVVDTFGMTTPGEWKLIIGRRGAFVLEVLKVQRLYYKGAGYDIAELNCLVCDKSVQIVDEYGDVSASLVKTE